MRPAEPVGPPLEEFRRSRRAFVRAHHPDRGGDPAVFADGLAQFDDPFRADRQVSPSGDRPPRGASGLRPQPSRVLIVRRPRGVHAWLRHLAAAAAARLGRQPPPRVR